MADSHSSVIPAFRYRDAPAAIEWLCKVLGFTRHAVYEGAGGVINHAELALGGGMIMLGSMKDDEHGRRFKVPGGRRRRAQRLCGLCKIWITAAASLRSAIPKGTHGASGRMIRGRSTIEIRSFA